MRTRRELAPVEVSACDHCPMKADNSFWGGDGYSCDYGTIDMDAKTAPEDCQLHEGDVIVRLKVYR